MTARPTKHPARRRPRQRSLRRASLAALFVLAALPRAGVAQDEIDRWVPSFSVFFDATGYKTTGSVTSSDVLGPPLTEGGCLLPNGTRNGDLCSPPSVPNDIPRLREPRKIRDDDEGSDTDIAPHVGGSIELMTPRLFEPVFSPRLFVHGDYAAAFGFERNVAGTGGHGRFAAPQLNNPFNPEDPVNDLQQEAVLGQGTRTKIQIARDVWSAGGGVAFSFKLFERRVRLKPSFEYTRYDLDMIGSVHRAVKLVKRSTPPTITLDPAAVRLISLEFNHTETVEGFGPGLELEADTANLGPFLVSAYFAGRGYYYPGKRDFSFTTTNEFQETATWTLELDSWSWRAGVGVRFRWAPERD